MPQERTMRKRKHIFAALLVVVLSKSATAQKQAPVPAQNRTVSQVLEFWISETERLVVPAAEAMPESSYSFAPTNGEFKGVRTFAEQVKHLAAANYQLGAGALGEDPPVGTQNESAPSSIRTKAEIIEYLRGSFACLHRAAAAINETNMNEPIAAKDGRTRMWLLIDAVAHSSNHYGQMVEYLRMNGIVPPASR
jgi:DinB superfamily